MATDAVTVAPHIYEVVLENDRVRVLLVCGNAGDRSDLHTHPAQVAVALTDGGYRFRDANGDATEVQLEAGMAMYLDPVEHSTELLGPVNSKIILVELK